MLVGHFDPSRALNVLLKEFGTILGIDNVLVDIRRERDQRKQHHPTTVNGVSCGREVALTVETRWHWLA